MDLSAPAVELLAIALRSRSEQRAELARLAGLDDEELDRRLAELQRAGFLTEAAGRLTYRRPDVATAELTRNVIADLGRQLAETVERSRATIGTLPSLLQAWELGNADAKSLPIDVLHGPWAPADMWQLQYSRGIPLVNNVCMPDTSAMGAVKVEHQASFWQARSGEPLDVRLLMSVTDATSEQLQQRIASEVAAGVRIRMHPALPSWFWSTDHDTVGLPLQWGQAWPTSVIAVKSPALAMLVDWVFERLWAEAVELDGSEHPWGSILELMDRGMTMESAAIAVGLAPRTGRRRVAQAMEHYGVSSLFALGAAWGARR